MVSKSDKAFFVALALKLVVLLATIYHVGCLLKDQEDGYAKFPDFDIVLLLNVFLLFGIIVHWYIPVVVWLMGYTLIILMASIKSFVTGKPYWTAGISHTSSTLVIQGVGGGAGWEPYDVAFILAGLHFVLVYLMFVAMVALRDAQKKDDLHLETSQRLPLSIRVTRGDGPINQMRSLSLSGDSLTSSSSTETLHNEPSENRRTRDAPPTYSEVQMPPKYEEAVV